MTNTNAPTITIDGVTSKPGEPVTMLALDCDDYPTVAGHGFAQGQWIVCPDCQRVTAITDSLETWLF